MCTICSQAVNLSANSTKTHAEQVRLELALNYANASETSFKSWAISTGSSSSLSTCTSVVKLTKTVSQCRQLLYYNKQVTLHLVKTVKRSKGHLSAVSVEKNCTTTPELINSSLDELINIIASSLQATWNDEW